MANFEAKERAWQPDGRRDGKVCSHCFDLLAHILKEQAIARQRMRRLVKAGKHISTHDLENGSHQIWLNPSDPADQPIPH